MLSGLQEAAVELVIMNVDVYSPTVQLQLVVCGWRLTRKAPNARDVVLRLMASLSSVYRIAGLSESYVDNE